MQSSSILDTLLDIAFPTRCMFCGIFTDQTLLICSKCWQSLDFITEPKCRICSFPFQFNTGPDTLCASCMMEKPSFDSALSLFKYNELSQAIVHKLKYGDQLHLAKFFAKIVAARFQDEISKCDLIVQVPLHRRRLWSRGHNQSALIANHLADFSGVPFRADVLLKTRYDVPQTKLNRERRKKNVLNSFEIKPTGQALVADRRVLLIDDVYTTGSTINECSKILKKAGCANVCVVTLAKVVG